MLFLLSYLFMEDLEISPESRTFLRKVMMTDDLSSPKNTSSTISFEPSNFSYIEKIAKDSGMSKSSIVNELIYYARRLLHPDFDRVLLSFTLDKEAGYLVLPRYICDGIRNGDIDLDAYIDEEYFVLAEDIAMAETPYYQVLASLPIYS